MSIASSPRHRRRVAIRPVLLALASLALATGCAEMITYSGAAEEKGIELMRQARYEEAAGAFRDAVRQNPRKYTSFFYLGACYERMGREQEALQSYHAALDVLPPRINTADPNERETVEFREKAVNGLAEFVARANSRDQELAAMEAKAQKSRLPIDSYALAAAHAAAGDADSAVDAYDQAFMLSERQDFPIAKKYALYLMQINQSRRAEPVLVSAYRLNPGDAEVNAALRKLGVVPGPSLLAPNQLHSPIVPKGPLPELK